MIPPVPLLLGVWGPIPEPTDIRKPSSSLEGLEKVSQKQGCSTGGYAQLMFLPDTWVRSWMARGGLNIPPAVTPDCRQVLGRGVVGKVSPFLVPSTRQHLAELGILDAVDNSLRHSPRDPAAPPSPAENWAKYLHGESLSFHEHGALPGSLCPHGSFPSERERPSLKMHQGKNPGATKTGLFCSHSRKLQLRGKLGRVMGGTGSRETCSPGWEQAVSNVP